ncbi:hypothetical protein GCM10009584_17390 [Ornithinimicrobium humiphilum]|uniref:Putative oligomerization/nucleic acid binding protein n=1 Tax=Ornithinimicrobium humiphilum TaxID=125288 RepID=A0A543KL66_9MICO|nr:SHOCT domain-containing protein [Ornithinimicrobium humiphilum]TQM95832.1 putative oligomerization/nucleic acid binding protein [Ornithinimicrobium humiphilum]
MNEVPWAGGIATAYRDKRVPKREVPLAAQSLQLILLPGERVLGLFGVTRLRRSVTLLVITDLRLLTLGDQHVGLPLVDEVHRADVTEVHLERERTFRIGAVTARTPAGDVGLGTLTYGKETFLAFERLLATGASGGMPVIPVPGGRGGAEPVEAGPAGRSSSAPASDHPLVVHLAALADLHRQGALTDEEFSAAKARLLADPEG